MLAHSLQGKLFEILYWLRATCAECKLRSWEGHYSVAVDTPWRAVRLQSASPHQTCFLLVHEPCQISPVQHGQSLLNWVRDSEFSLHWVDRWGTAADTVKPASKKGHFSEAPGWKDAWGITHFSPQKTAWAFIPPEHKQRVRRADTLTKMYKCLALTLVSLAKGLESINLIFSKSLTFRLPFPSKKPSLAALSWLLCKFQVGSCTRVV